MKKLNVLVAILVALAILFIVVMTVKSIVSGGGEPDVSATPPVTAEVPTATATPSGDVSEPPVESEEPTLPPIIGEEFTVTAPIARETLTLTIDTALYTHVEAEYGDMFYKTDDDTREVFIEIVFVQGDMSTKKGSFLENYLPDATNTEINGEVLVAASAVEAEGLQVSSASRSVDGWLIPVEGGFFAVVAGYKTVEQGEYIYRMLNTLVFEL
ncbi:MAG: hypothetical protein LBN00_09130 [Oscillospiraceae bacterium]|jgi:hypothetical protein|nr:hypothetical protein [Oscillospiraceae bacterium]